jgi:3-phenylpropionate/trans-cinnamate dioxygenase ferredoxin subunit
MSLIEVCHVDDIDEEDVIRFDHQGDTYAIYRTQDSFYATAGLCTHEAVHLADGLVIDDVVECPLHQGRFNIISGKALSAPVCVNLKTYPVQVIEQSVWISVQ